jgi:hypothetical protein
VDKTLIVRGFNICSFCLKIVAKSFAKPLYASVDYTDNFDLQKECEGKQSLTFTLFSLYDRLLQGNVKVKVVGAKSRSKLRWGGYFFGLEGGVGG